MRVLKHAAAESCPLSGEALILPRLPAPRDAAARIPLGAPTPAKYDADADAALESSERYYLAYDERWRVVATYRDSDASPKEQFVFHAADARGLGGSSYIDSRVLRDRDNTSCGGACDPWLQASDGTLEERRYYVQNWRADVVAIISDTNQLREFVRYSLLGVPTSFPRGDYDLDGDVDAADTTALGNFIAGGSYGWNLDFSGDGNTDTGDTDDHAAYVSGYAQGLGGRTVLSRSGVRNRAGYAGYEFEPALPNSAWHVRHRVLVSELGRWNRRDPLGYVDGPSLLAYGRSSPGANLDAYGLRSARCAESRAATCCDTEETSADCKQACEARPNDYGITPRDGPGPDSKPVGTCCLCMENIKRNWPRTKYPDDGPTPYPRDGYSEGLAVITQCIERHEQEHLNQCGGVPPCRECYAYIAEADCLASLLSSCVSETCQRMVRDALQRALDAASHNCSLGQGRCEKEPFRPMPCHSPRSTPR